MTYTMLPRLRSIAGLVALPQACVFFGIIASNPAYAQDQLRSHSSVVAYDQGRILSNAVRPDASYPPGILARVERAAEVIAQSGICGNDGSVTAAGYTPRYQRGADETAYFVDCLGSQYDIMLNASDFAKVHLKNPRKPISKRHALHLCRKAIMEKLHQRKANANNKKYQSMAPLMRRYPSSADFSHSSSYVSDNGTIHREVAIDFTGINGYGDRIPQRGECLVWPSGYTDLLLFDSSNKANGALQRDRPTATQSVGG